MKVDLILPGSKLMYLDQLLYRTLFPMVATIVKSFTWRYLKKLSSAFLQVASLLYKEFSAVNGVEPYAELTILESLKASVPSKNTINGQKYMK